MYILRWKVLRLAFLRPSAKTRCKLNKVNRYFNVTSRSIITQKVLRGLNYTTTNLKYSNSANSSTSRSRWFSRNAASVCFNSAFSCTHLDKWLRVESSSSRALYRHITCVNEQITDKEMYIIKATLINQTQSYFTSKTLIIMSTEWTIQRRHV